MTLVRGTFRVRGDTLEIFPAYEDIAVRVEFFGDEVERIVEVDPLTGEMLVERLEVDVYPGQALRDDARTSSARPFSDIEQELEERLQELEGEGKMLEAARLASARCMTWRCCRRPATAPASRTIRCTCPAASPGEQPSTLLDYFPDDFLLFIDESHISIPQVRGMYAGDRSRKDVLVEHGFRLPSARDNRPLTFAEFERMIHQAVFVSATPGPYEQEHSEQVVEQVIRPTGLIDPAISVRPTKGQIDDLLGEINARVAAGQRVLVTTLTKRMAEDLADYFKEMGIRTHYLHSEIDTLERVEILRDLRLGVYDVVVGINLLREGLDLPEVSLVAVLDADKEGFLRSEGSLIQTIGRAARHVDGQVIMYADTMTRSMKAAIDETYRRRALQIEHNERNGIVPRGIVKEIKDITDRVRAVAEEQVGYASGGKPGIIAEIPRDELVRMVKELEGQMKAAARDLEFEKAALLRDQIIELRRITMVDPVLS